MLEPSYFAELYAEHQKAYASQVAEFSLGGTFFKFNSQKYLMGVINLSPDSWYRESVCLNAEAAIQRGRILAAQGASIIDIGAESTLSEAERVTDSLQNSRLLPVVSSLAAEGLLISVETYYAEVAKRALEAGAKIINLTGYQNAEAIYELAGKHDAGVVICYVQGMNVREVGDFNLEHDPIPQMLDFFGKEVARANQCGSRKLFLDPGLGFYYRNLQDSAVRVRHQMRTFLNTFRLRTLGYPTCHALPHAFDFFREEVRSAEPFFATLAAMGGTNLFRTHEVPRTRAVLETLSAY
ncbi:MAG: dihydropteroate synthase [Verrucomicrobiota bacterium]|nr:dihydropteroate synthase [Verrucomicrobiota bacterium]